MESVGETGESVISQSNRWTYLLGSKVFNVVQNDMNGNIEKIRKCYDADPTKSHTLEKLVIDEQGLEFTSVALGRSINDGNDELSLAMKACPYRGYDKELQRRCYDLISKVKFFGITGDEYRAYVCPYRRILPPFIVDKLEEFYRGRGYFEPFNCLRKIEELCDYVQYYLIEHHQTWLFQNFVLTQQVNFKYSEFTILQDYWIATVCIQPEIIIFEATDFTSIGKEVLLSLYRNENLYIEEYELWDHIIRWEYQKSPRREYQNLQQREYQKSPRREYRKSPRREYQKISTKGVSKSRKYQKSPRREYRKSPRREYQKISNEGSIKKSPTKGVSKNLQRREYQNLGSIKNLHEG
ncbi:5480_t:CDS:10, partial [Rhizophagus irregularis]